MDFYFDLFKTLAMGAFAFASLVVSAFIAFSLICAVYDEIKDHRIVRRVAPQEDE